MPESFTFDPRDLVRKPHIECPKCRQIAFGIVIVGERDFRRRCRNCGYHSRHTLPPVRKTVVYLDQFVISNLMLVRSKSEKRVDEFYTTIYDKLMELLRLQAIVCPFSDGHRNESVVHPSSPEQLRDSYEVFAHSISFKTFEQIRYRQILKLVERVLSDDPSAVKPIEKTDVMERDPNVWFDRIRVSVKPLMVDGQLDALKYWRQKTNDGIGDVFQNIWKLQPERSWQYWRDQEARGWWSSFLAAYDQELRKMQGIRDGVRQPRSLADSPAPIVGLFNQIFMQFIEKSGSRDEAEKSMSEFFKSPAIYDLPFLQIQSALYATTAKKAISQVKLPTQGFSVDVDAMGCLLPYCDAMFMDREIAGLWRDIQSSSARRLPYETKVFSMASKGEFLSYLKEIDKSVPAEQRSYAEEVLG